MGFHLGLTRYFIAFWGAGECYWPGVGAWDTSRSLLSFSVYQTKHIASCSLWVYVMFTNVFIHLHFERTAFLPQRGKWKMALCGVGRGLTWALSVCVASNLSRKAVWAHGKPWSFSKSLAALLASRQWLNHQVATDGWNVYEGSSGQRIRRISV